jgi:citrate lyase subunit beta/citryl-CoA lyase
MSSSSSASRLRSLLFTPGDQREKIAKVRRYGADAVVLDLEDAVAVARKSQARSDVCEALGGFPADMDVMVRVNGADSGRLEADLEAVGAAGARAVIVPKVEDADTVRAVDALLAGVERGAPSGGAPVGLVLSIETAQGLLAAREIAGAAPARTLTLLFGSADFRLDLGLTPLEDEQEVLHARSSIVVAARATGLRPPVDGPYLELDDEAGLADSSRRARALGFGGRVVLHPRQLAAVHGAFGPDGAASDATARRIVAEFEAAERQGDAAIKVAGRFVDYPVYEQARRQLARAASHEQEEERA